MGELSSTNRTNTINPVIKKTNSTNTDNYGFSLWTSRIAIKKLRVQCVRRGATVPDVINALINEVLEDPKKINELLNK